MYVTCEEHDWMEKRGKEWAYQKGGYVEVVWLLSVRPKETIGDFVPDGYDRDGDTIGFEGI